MTNNILNRPYYSGTSGLAIPLNKTQYPTDFKDKSRLEFYASLFNSLEINSIFYKLPKKATIVKWAEIVPKDFRFTFKIPKQITHSIDLNFGVNDIIEFLEVIETVGEKKGCLLAQFPPSITIEKIEKFKKLLDSFSQFMKPNSWKLAIEFRHPSWYEPQVYELLKSFSATLVLHDMKNSATQWEHGNFEFVYLRFHGPDSRYRGNYNIEFLEQRAVSIKAWISERKTVYVYFNNTLGAAFTNLQTLNKLVRS